jgi:predicted nucleic acid-binding protein
VTARRLVVDASVAAKWLLPEVDSDAAARLLEDDDLAFHVPELFDAELGNVLWKRVQRREMSTAEAAETVALVNRIPATRHVHADLLEHAFALAVELSISVYDALYVSLALALDAPLVTSDQWLRERARQVVQVQSPRDAAVDDSEPDR